MTTISLISVQQRLSSDKSTFKSATTLAQEMETAAKDTVELKPPMPHHQTVQRVEKETSKKPRYRCAGVHPIDADSRTRHVISVTKLDTLSEHVAASHKHHESSSTSRKKRVPQNRTNQARSVCTSNALS